MGKARSSEPAVEAAIGYASDAHGNGLAYARATGARTQILRVAFQISQQPITDRAVAYAALTAVARALWQRGLRRVRFVLADVQFVDNRSAKSDLPESLVLPYVRLRCVLNSFTAFGVRAGATDELTQRARAEVALNFAA